MTTFEFVKPREDFLLWKCQDQEFRFTHSPHPTHSSWWSFYWQHLLPWWSFSGIPLRSVPGCCELWAAEDTRYTTSVATQKQTKVIPSELNGRKIQHSEFLCKINQTKSLPDLNCFYCWQDKTRSSLPLSPETLWHQGLAGASGDSPPSGDIWGKNARLS